MGTPQNPSPNPYPIRSPVPNSATISNPNPNPNPNPSLNANPAPALKSPSFEEVSKLFSLPLSGAADSLGVCPGVLKKVCYDNGLVRWPYRKFLAGKSIEEIKKDAAIQKEKQLAELKVAAQRNDSSTSSAVSTSLTPQPQSTNTSSLQETQTSRILTQQAQPTRETQIESFHTMQSSTMSKGSSPTFDEFKYGFPSTGLLSVSYRWWGNKSPVENGVGSQQSSSGDAEEKKQQPDDSVETAANLSSKEATEGKKNETDADPQWATSLSALRKRAAEDGKQALRLGVYRGYHVKNLDQTKKTVLLQIFKSSLPGEWVDVSSES